MSIEIGRFRVNWHLAGDTDRPVAAATFERLVDDVLEPALEDALAVFAGADELVAIRSVDVPRVVVRTASDAEVWAGQVSAAVAGTITAGGPGVVRYRSHAAASADIVRRVALGDARREWAWRVLGLWPAGGEPGDGLVELLAAEPGSVIPVLEAAGSALPALLQLLGSHRLARLSVLAWHAHGAAPVQPPAAAQPAVRCSAAVAETVTTAVARLVVDRLLPREPGQIPPVSAIALAALLVLHADPAAVRSGRGSAQVAALLAALAGLPGGRPATGEPSSGDGLAGAAEAAVISAPIGEIARTPHDVPGAERAVSGLAPGSPVDTDGEPTAAEVGAATRWAGLLFCLHPLRPLLVPGSPGGPGHLEIEGPVRDLVEDHGLVPLLYSLGTELTARATGRGEIGPAASDPALLAFCGLPLDADPPDAERRAPVAPSVPALADAVVIALRQRLAGRPLGAADERALLRAVLPRSGVILRDPGWYRVDLNLDEVTTDVRAAGLDVDPGWLPALGCVIRLRYG